MKKTLFLIAMIAATATAMAQNIIFEFQEGSTSISHFNKSVTESNISALLTEISKAASQNRSLNLAGINMHEVGKQNLNSLWQNIHFSCIEKKTVQPLLEDMNGFQVRGIPLSLTAIPGIEYNGSTYKELTISLSSSGQITGARFSLDNNSVNVNSIMGKGESVTDVRRRREILKFVEDFRCYYVRHDLNALRQVYSDDALIITGTVVNTRAQNSDYGGLKQNVKYVKYSKEEYLKSLEGIFNRNKYLNVEFEKISVVRHPARDNYYAVTLRQKWDTTRYKDEGWLFLVWEFPEDGRKPTIHVRTWQPELDVLRTGVFDVFDFEVPE